MGYRFCFVLGNADIEMQHQEILFDSSCKSSYFVFTTSPMLLSVIIVNFNVKYFLEQCLLSLENALKGIDAEVWVIDNCSTDGSAEFFKDRFPKVQFVWNDKNVGFGKANNQILDRVTGEYVLFLNPDTLLPENGLHHCLEYLMQHKTVGALGVRMIDGSGQYLPESKRGFPSPLTSFFKLSGFAALFPRSKWFARYYLGHLSETQTNEVDVLAGACLFVSRKALEITKGFDEAFFMYGEDVDLSYRIQLAGFKNVYFPDVTIMHFKGESTQKGSLKYVQLFYGAMTLFVKKHYGKGFARCYAWLIQGAIQLKSSFGLLSNNLKKPVAVNPKPNERRTFLALTDSSHWPELKRRFQLSTMPSGIVFEADFAQTPIDIDNIILYCKANNITDLLLDSSFLAMDQIVQVLDQLSEHARCWFYHPEARAVLTSGNKNTPGETMELIDTMMK